MKIFEEDFQRERSDRERMNEEKEELKKQVEKLQAQVTLSHAQVRRAGPRSGQLAVPRGRAHGLEGPGDSPSADTFLWPSESPLPSLLLLALIFHNRF